MFVETDYAILNIVSQSTHLTDVQEMVFRQCWHGRTYSEIAEQAGYNVDYIKGVGYRLWKLLSKKLGEKVTKSNVQAVSRRHLQKIKALTEDCKTEGSKDLAMLNLMAKSHSMSHQVSPTNSAQSTTDLDEPKQAMTNPRQDLSEAADGSALYGRTQELAILTQWIIEEQCRLVALLGVGGIGKTSLSVQLVRTLQGHFECVVWRSLRNAPSLNDLLGDLIQFFCEDQVPNLPSHEELRISYLLNYWRQHRCLLILDNMETILRGAERTGSYLEGYEGYGKFLQRVGEQTHQGCLVLTSREKCQELIPMEGAVLPVRSLQLMGLPEPDARKLFGAKGSFYASDSEWKQLIQHYAGNPLVLKMIAAGIHDLLDGNISKFLDFLTQGMITFDDVRSLLEQQFCRLCDREKEVMYWLAIERKPISFTALQQNILSSVAQQELSNTLRSLAQRSLIEKQIHGFTQQPVVMEYVVEQLIETVCQEIATKKIDVLNRHALISVQAKNQIRHTQILLILKRVIRKLLTVDHPENIRHQLTEISSILLSSGISRSTSPSREADRVFREEGKSIQVAGYADANILALLHQLQADSGLPA